MSRIRTNIDQSYKWNPDTLFSNEEEWKQAMERVSTRLSELRTEDLTNSAETLSKTLTAYFDLRVTFERVNVYASVRECMNTADGQAQELSGQASTLESRLKTARATIESQIQQTDTERIEEMLTKSGPLNQYEHYLRDLLRRAEHTGPPAVEEALSTLKPATGGNELYQTLQHADLSFPTIRDPDGDEVELTLNTYQIHLRSSNRGFRRTVYEHFYDTLSAYRHTIAAIFNQHVETAVRTAAVRDYESSLVSALDKENIPVAVYETLTDTILDNLEPLHDHLHLKRDRLGVETLRPWDTKTQLTDANPTIPYEKAKTLLVDAVAPLGAAYQSRLAQGLESGWIDVYETQNKTSGAFTIPAYSTQPFVLLNYHADVNSLFALAHEMGHAMHAALTSESQPMVYGYCDWFVSEIPSTLMQTLLVTHILETSDDSALRHAILDGWLDCFCDLLYRRTRYAVCERRMHDYVADGKRLTAERLDRCITDGWKTFNTPVALDERIPGEWMHTGYLVMQKPFYVYQYATGFSAALTLGRHIREEWDGHSTEPNDAAERYLCFLRQGSSDYPLDLLTDVGVDLTTAGPIERAIDAYRDALTEMTSTMR